MGNWNRWRKAQESERSWWRRVADNIEHGKAEPLAWYGWKASELERRISRHIDNEEKQEARILEVGSGPVGIVSFLPWGRRYAIDPLEDFYQGHRALTELRHQEVVYLKGRGEELPFNMFSFSVVIIDNVIDHTNQPEQIVKEIHRLLNRNGIMYLSVNIHTPWGEAGHRLLAACHIDQRHPHTYTKKKIRELIITNQFQIDEEEIEDYYEARKENRRGKSWTDKIKGYSGISEFQYHSICHKTR